MASVTCMLSLLDSKALVLFSNDDISQTKDSYANISIERHIFGNIFTSIFVIDVVVWDKFGIFQGLFFTLLSVII